MLLVVVHSLSHVDSLRPMGCSPPGPLSVGFPRQEHWSGLLFPPPGDPVHSGIEPESPAALAGEAGIFFTTSATWDNELGDWD